ncbi:MAG: hypothetical protein RL518_1645 [Pseudomonadota bacterium]|jgi:hypothetical protein
MKQLWIVIATCAFALPSYADDVWVQVRESRLRSKPLFYASTISSVRYGQRLPKMGEENGWVSVRAGGQQGYLPLSAVSSKTIVFSTADAVKSQADPTELVLAGKGFSKEIEQSLQKQDGSARYDLVDRVERQANASPAEVAQFIKQGGLK